MPKRIVVIALDVRELGNYFAEISGIRHFMPERFFT